MEFDIIPSALVHKVRAMIVFICDSLFSEKVLFSSLLNIGFLKIIKIGVEINISQ